MTGRYDFFDEPEYQTNQRNVNNRIFANPLVPVQYKEVTFYYVGGYMGKLLLRERPWGCGKYPGTDFLAWYDLNKWEAADFLLPLRDRKEEAKVERKYVEVNGNDLPLYMTWEHNEIFEKILKGEDDVQQLPDLVPGGQP